MRSTHPKDKSPLKVERRFLPSRLSQDLMASAYEEVAPIIRRTTMAHSAQEKQDALQHSPIRPSRLQVGGPL